jgi:lipopolysaccharide heptosyltransferase II
MGDVLMTTPALRALRSERTLTLLTSPSGARIGTLVPEADEVLVYEAPWMKSSTAEAVHPDIAMIERLRAAKFDAAVIFTTCTQSALPAALLCYLSGIPLRLAHCRENPYQLLTDWVPDAETPEACRHEVRRQLDLVATVGAFSDNERLSLRIPQHATARVRSLLQHRGLNVCKPWFCVHPGASASSRRYAPELFARAADEIHRRTGYPVLLAGGAHETDLVETIQRSMQYPSTAVAGELDLGELAAVISQASLLIANNSGPAHIAAAVGTPVVDLYALTNPQHTPWGVPHRVLNHDVDCRFCFKSICPEQHHRCLASVTPAEVVAAVRDLAAADAGAATAARARDAAILTA